MTADTEHPSPEREYPPVTPEYRAMLVAIARSQYLEKAARYASEEEGLCQCGCGGKTRRATHHDRKNGYTMGQYRRFMDGHHDSVARRVLADGYVVARAVGHPRAMRRYVFEHILVVERAMGKFLRRGAHVHHVDRNRGNNSPGNLVVCEDAKYHKLLHIRQAALDACGDANARRCMICKKYDNQDDILVRKDNSAHHRSCRRALDASRVRPPRNRLAKLERERCQTADDERREVA